MTTEYFNNQASAGWTTCGTFFLRNHVMKANCWYGKTRRAGGRCARPEDPQPARRDCEDHFDGDLRLRPAPLQRLHPDDGEGRHPRARVHGRSRRGRQRGQEPEGRRPRGGRLPDLRAAHCFFCQKEMYSLCENSNPNAWMAEKMFGHSPAGIFGYSHMTRRLRRRAGRIRARAVRRRRARSRSRTG